MPVTARPTVHDVMRQCGEAMPPQFGPADVIAWFRINHPDVPPSTIRTRMARSTEGSTNLPASRSALAPLFRRVGRGLYELAPYRPDAGTRRTDDPDDPERSAAALLFAVHSPSRPDEAQRRARARRFAESKREALRHGERWFGLSSHYGLIHEVDSSPADIIMADVPEAHGHTWATWVSIRLDAALGSVRGKRIRIDAPRQYTDLLTAALRSLGAVVEVPAPTRS